MLQSIFEVLDHAQRPMTAREIVSEGRRSGRLKIGGATPWKTVNARLSEEILQKRRRSHFMRVDSGRFALRHWDFASEHVAPRRTVALFDEDILVFTKDSLRTFVPADGLTRDDADHARLLSSCFPLRRREAETRFDVIQLVSVYVIRHVHKFLTHKRTKRLPEHRLHHQYSCFFGGHLNASDLMPLFRFSDPEQALYLLDRELSEELDLNSVPESIRFKGLLYEPSSQVSTQHLGVVFLVDLRDPGFRIGERGFFSDARFETVDEMRARLDDFENWSKSLIIEEMHRWN